MRWCYAERRKYLRRCPGLTEASRPTYLPVGGVKIAPAPFFAQRLVLFYISILSAATDRRGNDIMRNGKSRVAPRGFVEITVEIARSNDIKRGRQTPLVTAVSLVMRERTKRWAALCFLPALILTGDA